MSLTFADLDNLRRRVHDPIQIGELPNVIRVALNLRVPIVNFSKLTLDHINKKHPDITDTDLLLLPFVVRHGLILREKAKPSVLMAAYKDPMSDRHYLAAMKYTARACEVWLDSFYRTTPRKLKRTCRKCELLKEADR